MQNTVRKEEAHMIDVVKSNNRLMGVQTGMECSGIRRPERRFYVWWEQQGAGNQIVEV